MARATHTLFFEKGNPSFEDCDAAVLGVAFGKNASYGSGMEDAPEEIFAASLNIEPEQPMTGRTIWPAIHNMGIIMPKTGADMASRTEAIAKKALGAGKFFALLGGDHSVVNGLLGALPKDVFFVNFDAHLDLRDSFNPGGKLSHACVSRRIAEHGFEQAWVGVRDQVGEEELGFVAEKSLAERIFYCKTQPGDFYERNGFPAWMKKENMVAGGKLGEPQAAKLLRQCGGGVWLNIDLDCLDSREFPCTGSPLPFGLRLEALNELLFKIISKKNVIGFSLAEFVPDKKNPGCAITAAMVCYNIISWKFDFGKRGA